MGTQRGRRSLDWIGSAWKWIANSPDASDWDAILRAQENVVKSADQQVRINAGLFDTSHDSLRQLNEVTARVNAIDGDAHRAMTLLSSIVRCWPKHASWLSQGSLTPAYWTTETYGRFWPKSKTCRTRMQSKHWNFPQLERRFYAFWLSPRSPPRITECCFFFPQPLRVNKHDNVAVTIEETYHRQHDCLPGKKSPENGRERLQPQAVEGRSG